MKCTIVKESIMARISEVKELGMSSTENDTIGSTIRYCTMQNTEKGLCIVKGIEERNGGRIKEISENGAVEVSVEGKKVLRVNGIEQARVLDLSDEGDRWEGDILNDEPYGWGVLYDADGEKMYEGFQIGANHSCYGIRYYSDIQKVEYEGEWCEGKRWGRGVQYDRNGNTMFDGEWMNDEPVEKRVALNGESRLLHTCIEQLIVSNMCCNGKEWKTLDFALLSNLAVLQVGKNCFQHVEEVKLIGLTCLETVVIGKESFSGDKEEIEGAFYLKECERLRELKIGCGSFYHYSVCEIEHVDSLEVIEMGELDEWSYSFCSASLELKGKVDEERMMNRPAPFENTLLW